MFNFAECYSPAQIALSSSLSYLHGQDMGTLAVDLPARNPLAGSNAATTVAYMSYLSISFY